MTETEYSYNVNKNTIEKNGKCIAYLNVVDVDKIMFVLNRQEEQIKELKKENGELKTELNTYKRKFLECVDKKMK